MYYQNYEDYMRSVLGYPIETPNTYESYNYPITPYENNQIYAVSNNEHNELEDLYPDIYKLINPMVCKICDSNTKPLSRELVDQMTDEIYLNIENVPEIDTIVNVRVNTTKDDKDINTKISSQNRGNKNAISQNKNDTKSNPVSEKRENTEIIKEGKEDRQNRSNRTLRDLIKILILNQLLGGNNRPPRPPRPPFPGPGGNPSPRPPIRPPFPREDRYFNDYFKF